MSLMFTDDTATDEFVDALESAADRGVRVQIAADTFTYGSWVVIFPGRNYTEKNHVIRRHPFVILPIKEFRLTG